MPTHPRAAQAPEPIPAAVLGDRGVFAWQRALHVAGRGLPEPVRYTLAVLALYMDADGRNARPGLGRLAVARGKSERTLRTHLDQAVSAGWLQLVLRGGRSGDGTVRASVYAAVFPAEVFERLAELLVPAWGEPAEQLPVEDGPLPVEGPDDASTGSPELPVEDREGSISTGNAGLPVEDFSTGTPGLPVEPISTGNLGASTGSPALPPTDPSHRPDREIDRSAQERAAGRYLRKRYGAATSDRVIGDVCVVAWDRAARAGRPVGSLVRYLDGWKEGDLADVVAAAQDAEDAQRAADRPGDAPSSTHAPTVTTPASPPGSGGPAAPQTAPGWGLHRTVAEAIADATPDHPPATPAAPTPAPREPSLTAVPGTSTTPPRPDARQSPILTAVDGDLDERGLPAAEARAALKVRLAEVRDAHKATGRQQRAN